MKTGQRKNKKKGKRKEEGVIESKIQQEDRIEKK